MNALRFIKSNQYSVCMLQVNKKDLIFWSYKIFADLSTFGCEMENRLWYSWKYNAQICTVRYTMLIELKRAFQLSETMKSVCVCCIKHISQNVSFWFVSNVYIIFPWLNLNNSVRYFLHLVLSNFDGNVGRKRKSEIYNERERVSVYICMKYPKIVTTLRLYL